MWEKIRLEDPTAKLVNWNDPLTGKYIEDPDDIPSRLADFKPYSPNASPASDRVNYFNFAISSENDPTAFSMGRKNNPSLIYDWISTHGAETKKTVGNSKTTAHSNCTLYLVLIQKFPTSRTIGELFFAYQNIH